MVEKRNIADLLPQDGETEGIALPKKVDVDALLPRGKSMPSAKERREKGLEKVAV